MNFGADRLEPLPDPKTPQDQNNNQKSKNNIQPFPLSERPWVEISLISAVNEPAPGEHASVSDALSFALEKKQQGNASLILKDASDW